MFTVALRVLAVLGIALAVPASLHARQAEASAIVTFQRAADSYAFQHRRAERRGELAAPLVEGAFFTPMAASVFRDRIRASGCETPQPVGGDSAVPRPNGSTEGTRPLAPCLSAALPALPAELEYRVSGVVLLLADAHLHIVIDVLHAAFPVRDN